MGEPAGEAERALPELTTAPVAPGLSNRRLAWLAVVIAVASIVMAVAGDILGFARGSAVIGVAPLTIQDVFQSNSAVTFAVFGAVIARHHPRNAIVWLMCFLGASGAQHGFVPEYTYYALLIHPDALPLGPFAAWLTWWIWAPGILTLPLFILLFPDGRPLSPRWRWLVVVIVCIAVLESAAFAFMPSRPGMASMVSGGAWTGGRVPFRNPLAQPLVGSIAGPLLASFGPMLLVLLGCGVASTILRYRRSKQEQRLQLKWFLYAIVIYFILSFVPALTPLPNTGPQPPSLLLAAHILSSEVLPPLAMTLALTIAILKYRLYDIDVVINRTLVYGSLAAFITAVYIAIVVGIGTLMGSGGRPSLALSIIATAVVAVAFQPVRERLQKVANRLVYGRRATPYEVLSEFSSRVADSYAGEGVLSRMAQVLAEGTGADRAEVWLRAGNTLHPAARWPHANGYAEPGLPITSQVLPFIPATDRTVPVRHQGELLGALTITKRQGESITPVEEKLLDDLAHQAGLVLKNVGLTADLRARLDDLRASRQRLVAAQDQERRRLERNLHDGAQQHLVALKVKLGVAEMLMERDPEKAMVTIQQLKLDADDALVTLRDLARGIYPTLLADKGLAAALEAQARKATVPVQVEADGVGRYPQEIEAAVYFCCLEALQNVQKYATATRAYVRLAQRDGALSFEVQDDGKGFDTVRTKPGSGLTNMTDRLDALGGTVDVSSTPGRGTIITGVLTVKELMVTSAAGFG